MSQSSRILVTGASGFLGRAVITGSAGRGERVRAAMRRPAPFSLADGVEIVEHPDLAQRSIGERCSTVSIVSFILLA